MRLNHRGLTIAVLAAAVFGGGLSAAERQGPRIQVQETRYDFGMVEQGAQPEHIFEIKNTGDEVLELQQIQPT